MFMQLKDNKNNFFEAYKTINDMVNQMNIKKDTLFLMCKNLRKDIEDGYKVENKSIRSDKPQSPQRTIKRYKKNGKPKNIQETTKRRKDYLRSLNDDLLKKMRTDNYSQYRDSYKDLLF